MCGRAEQSKRPPNVCGARETLKGRSNSDGDRPDGSVCARVRERVLVNVVVRVRVCVCACVRASGVRRG